MRILVISNLFPPNVLGGYELLCAQVCSELQAAGHEIRVLTSGEQMEDTAHHPVDRSLSLYLPFAEPAQYLRFRRWFTQHRNYSVTRRVISKFQPDIIFVWSQLRLTVGCALAAEESGIPVAYTMNDEHLAGYINNTQSLKGSIRRLIDERLLQIDARQLRLDHVTCISQTLKSRLCAGGLPFTNAKVIYQGIPVDQFLPKPIPGTMGSEVSLLYVGQLHEYKGVHTLIEAAEQLHAAGRAVSVTICGSGNPGYEARLRQLAARGYGKVRFLSRLPHSDVARIYRSHDVLVFPSIWCEPFGLTHLEAMASGTLVVSTSGGGHGEFLRHRENSLVFEPDSAKDLADKLTLAIDDPQSSQSIAQSALDQVRSQFTLQAYAGRLETWLEGICSEERLQSTRGLDTSRRATPSERASSECVSLG